MALAKLKKDPAICGCGHRKVESRDALNRVRLRCPECQGMAPAQVFHPDSVLHAPDALSSAAIRRGRRQAFVGRNC